MKVHVFTPVLGLYEGLPVSDFGPLVLPLLALPMLAFIASFSLSLSLSPLRGPGAGRPWPNPNSANSVSTQVGGGGVPFAKGGWGSTVQGGSRPQVGGVTGSGMQQDST